MRGSADARNQTRGDAEPMSRRMLVVVALAVATGAAALAVALLLTSGTTAAPQAPVTGAARIAAMLGGIPQNGNVLGSRTAPVTLVEFADPQCPYCGIFERDALPTIVSRYVRPGKVRIVFEGMTFVGPDSATALRTALAAAGQNRFWNVLELLYENQGTENAGWVTDALLRGIGAAVPGLDTGRMLSERNSATVDAAVARASAAASNAGITGTPSFLVGRTGGAMQLVHATSLTAAGLTPALDAALAQ